MTDGSSIRAAFAPHLPHLRRYARILTGSQRSGDTHVRQTLETILQSRNAIDEASAATHDNPKRALFRLFSSISQAVVVASTTSLPPGSMQALLLTEIEGFTPADVAYILGTPQAEIATNVQLAKAAIAETIRSRVLIIEDEALIAMHLEQIVEDMGHDVVAIASTHKDALARAHEMLPELVLADIQLADGSSGLEAAHEILKSFDVPVIFITAYPERLLTGERPEPTFLVTKPFKVETVVATIGQALLARAFNLTDVA